MSRVLTLFLLIPSLGLASTLVIAAAADLAPLEKELTALANRHGLPVRFTFGSSGLLARQIEHGAPYDVYLSANEAFVHRLGAAGHLAPGTGRVYARGRLALWSKRGSVDLAGLLSPAVRHVAIPNPQHAPYGLAAKQALERQDLWARIQPKVVYAENVRQAFQFAESGNAEAALVAWSLVIHRGGVLLPEEWHNPIRQAAGVVASSRLPAEARRFLDLLSAPEGAAILKKYGFVPSGEQKRPAQDRKAATPARR